VAYDRLVHPDLLAEARGGAEKICVGKAAGHFSFPQAEINGLLVDWARRGKDVVRLKGGDPFVFGRGAEEAVCLKEAGIPFEIIPGVSSAFAVPESAGIPVTYRGISSSVSVVSGHQTDDPENPLDWGTLARGSETVVVLMPMGNLRSIVASLIHHGRSIATPAAVIERGTYAGQRTVEATLGGIVSEAHRAAVASPAVLVVGEVVRLRERLSPRTLVPETPSTSLGWPMSLP